MRVDCLWSLRIASSLAVVRAIETVCIGTQRGFERYGEAVRFSVFARLLSLIAAVVVPLVTSSVTSVMVATAGISLLSVWLQMTRLHSLLGVSVVTPLLDAEHTRALLSFGTFTWIQAVSALLFGQVDRVITGVAFGAVAVSSYSLCAQMSQPVYGITAAGLHFLVPRITIQRALGDWTALRRTMFLGFCANSLIVALGTTVLLLFGEAILRIWGGEGVARIGKPVLPLMVWGTALPALTVSGVYSMLALDRVRTVTLLSLIAGAMMLVSVPWLLAHYGVVGMAYARIIYGPISLVIYFPLFQFLRRGRPTTQSNSDSEPMLCEAGQ
jgi:O-antigen/teichoic acid export membrane protein